MIWIVIGCEEKCKSTRRTVNLSRFAIWYRQKIRFLSHGRGLQYLFKRFRCVLNIFVRGVPSNLIKLCMTFMTNSSFRLAIVMHLIACTQHRVHKITKNVFVIYFRRKCNLHFVYELIPLSSSINLVLWISALCLVIMVIVMFQYNLMLCVWHAITISHRVGAIDVWLFLFNN